LKCPENEMSVNVSHAESVPASSSRTRFSDGSNALWTSSTRVRQTSPRTTSRRSSHRSTAPQQMSSSHSVTQLHSVAAVPLALHASTITWMPQRSLNQSTDSSELASTNGQTAPVSRRRKSDDDSRSSVATRRQRHRQISNRRAAFYILTLIKKIKKKKL